MQARHHMLVAYHSPLKQVFSLSPVPEASHEAL